MPTLNAMAPAELVCRCRRCKARRPQELTRKEQGGQHIKVNGQPAYMQDERSGTLLYLVETREPCDCGERRVLLGLRQYLPTVR